jgi:hypothetical protein
MLAKRNWLSVRLVAVVVITAIAAVMIVSCIMAYQQGQHESDGILFEIHASGFSREPATETMVQISIMHTCVFNDELVLEKVEICGETGVCVQSLEVNRTLNSVFWKKLPLDALVKLIYIPIVGVVFYLAAGELGEEIRVESFGSPTYWIDLRQIKQSLTVGDKIPIIVKATLIHNGKRLTLERELIVEYLQSF